MTQAASRYDYQFDPAGDSTAARVCRLVGADRKVLEVGCAAGAMSAVLSRHYGCRVTGVEYDSRAAEQARQYCEQVLEADLDAPDWAAPLRGKVFDTVLAADVLEHLRDPLACLRQLRTLLADDGRIVVSVPSIAHNGVLAALLSNEFEYRETGLLDRTHIHFFTGPTLQRMLNEAGFRVLLADAVEAGPEHPEFSDYWKCLPAPLAEWLGRNPAGRAYQVIVQAVPDNQPVPLDRTEALVAQRQWQESMPDAKVLRQQQEDYAALQARLEASQAGQEALRAEVDGLAAALDAAKGETAAVRREVDVMMASHSWRVTAPLRKISDLLKGRVRPHSGSDPE